MLISYKDLEILIAQVKTNQQQRDSYLPQPGISIDWGKYLDEHKTVCDVVIRASPFMQNPYERKYREHLFRELENLNVVNDSPSQWYRKNNFRHFSKNATVLCNPLLEDIDHVRSNAINPKPVFIPYTRIEKLNRENEKFRRSFCNRKLTFSESDIRNNIYRHKETGERYVKLVQAQITGIEPEINLDLKTDGYNNGMNQPELTEKLMEKL